MHFKNEILRKSLSHFRGGNSKNKNTRLSVDVKNGHVKEAGLKASVRTGWWCPLEWTENRIAKENRAKSLLDN